MSTQIFRLFKDKHYTIKFVDICPQTNSWVVSHLLTHKHFSRESCHTNYTSHASHASLASHASHASCAGHASHAISDSYCPARHASHARC